MSSAAVDVLVNLADQLGEGPLWSATDCALWWVDIEGRRLRRYDWNSRKTDTWETPERFSALVLKEGGGLLAAGEDGLFHVTTSPGAQLLFRKFGRVLHPYAGMRFNEGRTDRAGSLFVSSIQMDRSGALPSGSIYRLEGGSLRGPVLGGLITANGMAFSPDNRTMYLCDSHVSVQRIWSFDRSEDGTLLGRREFVDMTALAGRPDGASVDADGCYWVCATDAGKVHRFDPNGRLDSTLSVPVSKPTACTFAGPDLGWLVVTSMQLGGSERGAGGLDGAVFITRPGVQGLLETACSTLPSQRKARFEKTGGTE